ncbi:MAG TPA: hypothetical protein GXZ36_04420 [Firmicutes bacterium]|nr:hypothetical protein [Bacillota bacterium]
MKAIRVLPIVLLLICLTAAPAFAQSHKVDATVLIPAELTVKPLLILSVNGVKDFSNDWLPGGVLTHSFRKEVTPVPGQEATYVESRAYEVWVYSNAPWAARIGRTDYIVRAARQSRFENQIDQENRLGFEYRKTDSDNWQPLNVWSMTPIWDAAGPTGNDGQELGSYQFRGVVDSRTTPGKYSFAVYFTAYQE